MKKILYTLPFLTIFPVNAQESLTLYPDNSPSVFETQKEISIKPKDDKIIIKDIPSEIISNSFDLKITDFQKQKIPIKSITYLTKDNSLEEYYQRILGSLVYIQNESNPSDLKEAIILSNPNGETLLFKDPKNENTFSKNRKNISLLYTLPFKNSSEYTALIESKDSKNYENATIQYSYQMNGLSWNPSYILEEKNGVLSFEFWATLQNQTDIDYNNISLKLAQNPIYKTQEPPRMMMSSMKSTESYENKAFSQNTKNGTSIITYDQPLTLKKRTYQKIPLFLIDSIPYTKEIHYTVSPYQNNKETDARETYIFENPSKTIERLPQGNITVKSNEIKNFESIFESTEKEEKINVSAGKNTTLIITESRSENTYEEEIKITVKNTEPKNQIIKIKYPSLDSQKILHMSYLSVNSQKVSPIDSEKYKEEKNQKIWTLSLKENEEKTLTMVFNKKP